MKYLFAGVILLALVGIYAFSFILNSRIPKPKNCEIDECMNCKINCSKRSE